MDQTPVRAVGEQTCSLPARDIPRLGFGTSEVTRKVLSSGGLVLTSWVVRRIFRLCCECYVSCHEECGGSCIECVRELQESLSDELLSGATSPEELQWMATHCKEHLVRCFRCSLGLCRAHAQPGPDGQWYCEPHFHEVSYAEELATIEEKRGILAARFYAFGASLFFDKPGVQ